MIDPRRKHPGLADRLKAIIAAYNQAKLHGLKFKIVYKIPFALENYLLPTSDRNNWIANYDDLEYSIRDTRFVDESRDWKFHPKKGKQYHCYNYTGDISPKIFKDSGYEWSALFSELFTPCDEIRLAMAKTGLERKTYNAVHLRFVNALDNFEAGHYNNLQTEEEKLALITRCKGGVKNIIDKSKKEGIDKVVVFSDSKRFLNSLSDLPVIVLDPSSIGHISFDNSHAQVIKTFLDFFMISDAVKVYRVCAKEMYLASCFSLCAARTGDAEFISVEV